MTDTLAVQGDIAPAESFVSTAAVVAQVAAQVLGTDSDAASQPAEPTLPNGFV